MGVEKLGALEFSSTRYAALAFYCFVPPTFAAVPLEGCAVLLTLFCRVLHCQWAVSPSCCFDACCVHRAAPSRVALEIFVYISIGARAWEKQRKNRKHEFRFRGCPTAAHFFTVCIKSTRLLSFHRFDCRIIKQVPI